jgi:hypothetical protein
MKKSSPGGAEIASAAEHRKIVLLNQAINCLTIGFAEK